MKLIESKTLGTAQASIEFTSIPQTYTDLVLMMSLRNSTGNQASGGGAFRLDFNNYATQATNRALRGQGSGSPASFTDNFFSQVASDYTANTFGNGMAYIPNYTSATAKSFLIDSVGENNATFSEQQINAQLWNVTDAITAIRINSPYAGGLAAGCIASLYGVLKGSDGIVTTS
jgi:hypothetical protein